MWLRLNVWSSLIGGQRRGVSSGVSLFEMCNDEIAFCNECKYLGRIFANNLSDKSDVIREIRYLLALNPMSCFINLVHVQLT